MGQSGFYLSDGKALGRMTPLQIFRDPDTWKCSLSKTKGKNRITVVNAGCLQSRYSRNICLLNRIRNGT